MNFGCRAYWYVLRDRNCNGVQAYGPKTSSRARTEYRHGSCETPARGSCSRFRRPNCTNPKQGGATCGGHAGAGYAASHSNPGSCAHYRITPVTIPKVIYDRGETTEEHSIAAATRANWPRGIHSCASTSGLDRKPGQPACPTRERAAWPTDSRRANHAPQAGSDLAC